MTRRLRTRLVIAGVACTAVLLGAWWWTSVAWEAKTRAEPSVNRVAPELFERSRGFRELLAAVAERGRELDRREEAIAVREAALDGLAATLGEQIGKVEACAAAPIAAADAGPADAPPCAVVAGVYGSMDPEDAAAIIDRLDDATTASIFACMKQRQIAAILARVSPERAVALTKALAGAS